MEKWLSIFGAVASIGGALWALYEARQASKSASKAEIARDELIERRKMVEVSKVHTETDRILKTVSTVGPSCNRSLLQGVSCASIAKEVEEYSRFINEQSSHFSDSFENKAKKMCDDLNENIEALSEAKSFDEKKKAGKSIYYRINTFMPTVKALSDEKKERAIKS